ncbi:hypothetical protein F4819DRAFT_319033 [Hypoxylon fuscum]|nr:hypothetical protein F4819DRAFT_319033 [Hypoxylon fuscum]
MDPHLSQSAVPKAPTVDRSSVTSFNYSLLALSETTSFSDEQFYTKRRHWYDRIGSLNLVILIMGSMVLLASISILAIIWGQAIDAATGHEPSWIWTMIFESDWTTKVVTISTAVIRTIITIQASLITAMVASLMLEIDGVPLIVAPIYSTVRALQAPPHNLLSRSSIRIRGLLPIFLHVVILIKVILNLHSQFMSTILVSDFTTSQVVRTTTSETIRILNYENHNGVETNYWATQPSNNWRFGEYTEAPSRGADFEDTGSTYRALLPLSDESSRSNLRKLDGPVHIIDHRVVCLRPTLKNINDTLLDERTIQGQLRFDKNNPTFTPDPAQLDLDIDCYLELDITICGAQEYFHFEDTFVKRMSTSIFFIIAKINQSQIDYLSEPKDTRTDGPWATLGSVSVTACTSAGFTIIRPSHLTVLRIN